MVLVLTRSRYAALRHDLVLVSMVLTVVFIFIYFSNFKLTQRCLLCYYTLTESHQAWLILDRLLKYIVVFFFSQRQFSSPDTLPNHHRHQPPPPGPHINIHCSNVTGLQCGNNNTMYIHSLDQSERKRHPTAPSRVNLPPQRKGSGKDKKGGVGWGYTGRSNVKFSWTFLFFIHLLLFFFFWSFFPLTFLVDTEQFYF